MYLHQQLWNSDHGHVVEACKDILKKLGLSYLDLYLVHFPVSTTHTGLNFPLFGQFLTSNNEQSVKALLFSDKNEYMHAGTGKTASVMGEDGVQEVDTTILWPKSDSQCFKSKFLQL